MADDLKLRFKVTDEGTALLDKIHQKIGDIDTSAKKMGSSLSLIKLDSLINLGQRAVNAGRGMYDLMRSTAAAGDEIVRNAAVMNMTTGEYQKWQYVAYRADVEAKQFATGLKILSRNMLEASRGMKEYTELFDALGIKVTDQQGNLKSYEEMLGELSDTFSKMPDGPEKVALALEAFGRSGEALIPLLNRGRDGVGELTAEFKRLGIEIEQSSLVKLAAADEGFEKFEATMKRLQIGLTPIVGIFADVAEKIALFTTEFSANQQRIDVEQLKTLKEELKGVEEELDGLSKGPDFVSRIFGTHEGNIKYQTKKAEELKEKIEGIQKSWATPIVQKIKTMAVFQVEEGGGEGKIKEAATELEKAYKDLGIRAKKTFEDEMTDSLRSVEVVKKAMADKKASTYDYLNALKAAGDKLKQLLGITEDTTDKRAKAEQDYQKKVREISRDDPERQRKVQAVIDEWAEAIKEIEKLEPVNIKIATEQAEKQLQEFITKATQQGITLPVSIEGSPATAMGGGGSPSMIDYMKGKTEFFQGGRKAIDDMNDSFQDFSDQWGQGLDFPILISGIGSSKKPITEKIREIIGEFGGLEKAMSGMEAEINVAELSSQYSKLDAKLKQIERIIPDMSAMASWAGGSPYVGGPIIQTVTDLSADLTEQMRILQMKMNYEMLKMYGGSFQTGTDYVPRTALYKLHEGERVISKNVSATITNNFNISGGNPRETADQIEKVLKYNLSGSLRAAIKNV